MVVQTISFFIYRKLVCGLRQMLAVQLLALPIGAIGMLFAGDMPRPEGSQTDWIHVDASLDFSGVVMVVVLFILARVFRQGAAMRADLEGTV